MDTNTKHTTPDQESRPPIAALPPPNYNWKTPEHFLRTVDGFLDAAREYLTPEQHTQVLDTVREDCTRRLSAAEPQTLADKGALAAAMLGALTRAPRTLVLWGGLKPVVTNGAH